MTEKDIAETAINAWISLHRAHRLLLDKVESELKRHELPPLDWYDVLLELHRAGTQGLRQYQIGERILLTKHNLSRLLDRLEKQDLLTREVCEEDGRGYRVFLSGAGSRLLKTMWPVYRRAILTYFSNKLSDAELKAINASLEKVILP